MDWNELFNKMVERPIGIVCVTIVMCAAIFGGVCCVQAEYQYKIKRQELWNQGSKDFFNKKGDDK